jgi:hypothetical protein
VKTTIGVAVGALLSAVVLAGCENGGRGNTVVPADMEGTPEKLALTPVQGPGGGEFQDKTFPVGRAALAKSGSTASAFPATVLPRS